MHITTDSNWPRVVDDFAKFLTDAGLQFQTRKEEAVFSNKTLQYGGQSINVRIVSEKGVWYVEIADASHQSNEWYDAAILRDLILGPGEDVLSLQSQIEIIETNWAAINSLFSPSQEKHTHPRLAILREERAKRRFPNLL
ncbi:MAG: hypothetical protein M3Y50_11925 [Acidobacteriota bacterium]|nr:hypothetical protein [Acidobacteriota bacterium]